MAQTPHAGANHGVYSAPPARVVASPSPHTLRRRQVAGGGGGRPVCRTLQPVQLHATGPDPTHGHTPAPPPRTSTSLQRTQLFLDAVAARVAGLVALDVGARCVSRVAVLHTCLPARGRGGGGHHRLWPKPTQIREGGGAAGRQVAACSQHPALPHAHTPSPAYSQDGHALHTHVLLPSRTHARACTHTHNHNKGPPHSRARKSNHVTWQIQLQLQVTHVK